MSIKAVFLDKNGTLIKDVPYNVDPKFIQLTLGAVEGLQLLHAGSYSLIVITNQSGIAHGYFLESALVVVERQLRQLLAEVGVPSAISKSWSSLGWVLLLSPPSRRHNSRICA